MDTAASVGVFFFPNRVRLGFDAREYTPLMVERMVVAAAETRSFKRSAIVMKHVGGQPVSFKTIQRITSDVGSELGTRRDASAKSPEALAKIPEDPPDLAVIETDGGRIHTREPGHGPGVHLNGEGWRETKNSCLIRAQRKTFDSDPQPDPPACFLDAKHVAKIAETSAVSTSLASEKASDTERQDDSELDLEAALDNDDWRPKRLVRTVVSSMACSRDFGRQVAREARRRRFYDAAAQVFLGDGLPWNWSIQKEHFPKAVPILDFTHVLSYLFLAAKAIHADHEETAWSQYVAWMTGCWRSEASQVIEELDAWQCRLGLPAKDTPESDVRAVVATTLGYLRNNLDRMDYANYRQSGYPVTTAWMESLVKEMNYRVKGSEMFWNDPTGAEAILQVRAAGLSDDERLIRHLRQRPGSPFTRRPKPPSIASKTRKS